MGKEPKRCKYPECTTFVGKGCHLYCSEHSRTAGRVPKPRGTGGRGGKKPGTDSNPMRKQQVGNKAKVHEVGLMDSFGERQILRSIFGGG